MAKRHNKGKIAAEVGLGLALAAAAAAGAYYLSNPKNRKKVGAWAFKLRGEVLEKMEKMREMNEKRYHEIIDSVARRYQKMRKVNSRELAGLVKELKGHWKNIKREMKRK